MKGQRGSFLGFTFNNVHSSVLGITRTSDGSRFNYNLVPSLKDLVVEPTGVDGQYFFGATYSKQEFVVNYAFEGMTETQMSDIKRLWNDKHIHDLIFDELPYKVYSAKITGTSQMKHLAFVENGERVYKGEGSFNFTCYFPFARSRYEYKQDYVVNNIHEWVADVDDYILREDAMIVKEGLLNSARIEYDIIDDEDQTVNGELIGDNNQFTDWLYDDDLLEDTEGEYDETFTVSEHGLTDSDYNNYNEWIAASKIPDNLVYGKFVGGRYRLYNAGDIPTPFKIWFRMPQNSTDVLNFTITCGDKTIQFSGITNQTLDKYMPDYYCVFDVATNSVEGYSADKKQTGTLYNSHIAAGVFFELPVGEQDLYISGATPHSIDIKYYYL